MTSGTQARADWRGLFSAALIGSGVGLSLGVTYLAAGMANIAADHVRAERIAQTARGGFSDATLQGEMDRMDPAARRLARAYDTAADHVARDDDQSGLSALRGRRPANSPLAKTRELDCLTQAIYFEARGESTRGQAAVAQVVMNRVASPSFPKSVCGVVFQGAATHGCQFSFACDGSMSRGREAQAWDRARRVAERALSGVVLADIGKATHFHTIGVRPDWGPQMLRVAQVGLHVFYRFNPHAPASRPEDRAVFVNLPMSATSNLRLTTVVLQKTAGAAVAASGLNPALTPLPAPVAAPGANAKAPPPPAKPAEPVTLSKASQPVDAAQSVDAAAS